MDTFLQDVSILKIWHFLTEKLSGYLHLVLSRASKSIISAVSCTAGGVLSRRANLRLTLIMGTKFLGWLMQNDPPRFSAIKTSEPSSWRSSKGRGDENRGGDTIILFFHRWGNYVHSAILCRWFQGLSGLREAQIHLEEVQEQQHSLVDILHTSTQGKVVLPINWALLSPAHTVWQITATILPTLKRSDKKYHVPAKGSEYLFSHQTLNSLVISATNGENRHYHFKLTPSDKELKWLALVGHPTEGLLSQASLFKGMGQPPYSGCKKTSGLPPAQN